ncbi:MAG: putative nucleoside-diphosphate sugar epimerase [uncultured bacterium]|nr:MAG: putative nucleoside-diphosphate sugar epimerase [uncultured bacterium]OFW68682.1 MAG: hypothetical protein A2X70_04365 [Alphaproteobacteria bacterium GWC2_42_16]OFW73319.1 MAG: hypothetical protein A2Z80_07455 [Alphaproteobacteria bacterium GWA2_41_27]OFW81784.1 MAG: hypothetical protein A3E50_02720 [Alphaproteobacteria bacterium RIFCSPHIGHO2_12_FULL_42_100]OFW85697.1 MAG: hypothetical protein A2W06_06510 [Alphaproteobacteria bacterium RBG_16_42_14]OFW90810.1 MAG: hypothetical protein 
MKKLNLKILPSLLLTKEILLLIQDLSLLTASLYITLFLQLGENFYELSTSALVLNTFLYTLFGLSVFLSRHIYQMLFIDSSWGEWTSISLSVTCITLLYLPVTFLLPKAYTLPDSIPLVNWFVAISLLEYSRFLHRLYRRYLSPKIEEAPPLTQKKVLDITAFLKRDPLIINEVSLQNFIQGKRVLITGAGGTLGSAFAKRIAPFSPTHLCFVDQSESLLQSLMLDMNEICPKVLCDILLGDITSRERIRHIISMFKPDIVLHAAALKQVPLVEENLSQAILTNAIGTQNVADACRDFKVGIMLLLSTNEAILPKNIMGATKRLSEMYCFSLDNLERKKPNGTRYVCVEFCNVLGAEGSVIPLFKRQIEKGGPLTLTHADMTRYFIPLEDVVNLSLEAMILSKAQKTTAGKVFLLDMGAPIKIIELANWLMDSMGAATKINYTGLRPGEKITEEISLESFTPSSHPKILQGAFRTMDHGFLMRAFHELEAIAKSQDTDSMRRLLQALIPEYKKEASYAEAALEEVS